MHHYLVRLQLLFTEKREAWMPHLHGWQLFPVSQSWAHSLLIHATSFCYQVNAASFQRELMLIKLVGHTLEHLLRSSGCTFPDHSRERKQPVDQ